MWVEVEGSGGPPFAVTATTKGRSDLDTCSDLFGGDT